MIDGVENYLTVIVYNENGLSTTQRRKFNNNL